MPKVQQPHPRLQSPITEENRSYWPTAQQELLLRAACTRGTGALTSWREWRESTDLERLDAGSYRLLPLLFHSLSSQGVQDDWLPRLKTQYIRQLAKNHQLFRDVGPVLGALEAAGVQPMLLKGVALALAHYSNPALRPMSDCDIMVRPHDLQSAGQVLNEHGWRGHECELFTPSNAFRREDGLSIDLHQHAFFQCPFDKHDEELWQRSKPLEVGGVAVRRLCATDQLLYVCIHGLRWDPVPPVRWAADMLTILSGAETIEWDVLVRASRERRLTLQLSDALTYLQRTFDVPVPEGVLAELANAKISRFERREHLAWSRPPQQADGLWLQWARYRRLQLNAGTEHQMPSARFFQLVWKLDGVDQLPRHFASRVRAKMGTE